MGSVDFRELSGPTDVESAARLAQRMHAELRVRLPFLPARGSADVVPRIEWVARQGVVLGRFTGDRLTGFLGAFPIESYRNAGRGSFGPDWCQGLEAGRSPARAYPELYRELAPRLLSTACRIHGFALYASQPEAIQALRLIGFGHVVLDAARPTEALLRGLPVASEDVEVRRAEPADADVLARLDAGLAEHIAAAPVLIPHPRSRPSSAWAEWLGSPARWALLACVDGRAAGFIKAEDPQDDVSYAVHDPGTLAINGMFVAPASRRRGVGAALLAALVRRADEGGRTLLSVDCETTNIEALAFWTRWFEPVSWSLERRV